MSDDLTEYRTYFVPVQYTQNIGCSQCGDMAVQVLVCQTEKALEIVESQCQIHRSVE